MAKPPKNTEGGSNSSDFELLSYRYLEALQKQAIKKPKRTKEDWRSIFALIILSGYFIILGGIVMAWLFGREVDSVIKILSSIGALLGSPLGFVIGYYYKGDKK